MTSGARHLGEASGARTGRPVGLSDAEVIEARNRHGENRLPEERSRSGWSILIGQFASPLVYIILAAAAISLAVGELGDFAIIAVVIAVDVLLGFAQEYQAQRTYVALRGLLRPTTTVIRNGARREVECWELVPGDLVIVASGDRVPADGLLAEAVRLAVDEAVLTGESEPVSKSAGTGDPGGGPPTIGADPTDAGGGEPGGPERTKLLMGSTVLTGRGTYRVTATGMSTELGQIAASIAGRDEGPTPLQVRLREFSRVLTLVVIGATVAILVAGLAAGRDFLDMLRTSIVLAIAAVPEGLIIAVTVILVVGMRKILRRRGLVRRLLAVETLGSVTVICTDKTGTLTEGRMRVSRVDLADDVRAWQTMVLCNDLEGPVDVALWEHAEAAEPGRAQALVDRSERFAEELFTSETKYMIAAVTGLHLDGGEVFFLKGAPEVVLAMCALPVADRERLTEQVDAWAAAGLRLLGLAARAGGRLDDHDGYTWVGLVGLEDPVREEVREAVALARRAGIRVIMLTGDYRRTAESVARSIGLPIEGPILEGRDVAALSPDRLRRCVREVTIFARIRPRDKLRIVRALQDQGQVTAMIGDGVNDAPALAHADIGVVVGSATDVARETADLILLDGNFRTVVAAVEEGRAIFDNIRKVVAYVLSNSFAEVLTIFVAMLLGWPTPLLVAQILWIHLICDGPLDIVLGFEPAEPGTMERPPRGSREPVLDRLGGSLIATISLVSAAFALAVFGYHHLVLDRAAEGRSIVFATFALASAVYILAYRSMRTPLIRMTPITRNRPLLAAMAGGAAMTVLPFLVPFLREPLGLVPLSPAAWAAVVGFAILLLAMVELAKAVAARRHPLPAAS